MPSSLGENACQEVPVVGSIGPRPLDLATRSEVAVRGGWGPKPDSGRVRKWEVCVQTPLGERLGCERKARMEH